jgi:hypothetical protein
VIDLTSAIPDISTVDMVTRFGFGLLVFKTVARSLPAPKESSWSIYVFFFNFCQNLIDNLDKLKETRPSQGESLRKTEVTDTSSSGSQKLVAEVMQQGPSVVTK